mmetsp:Transcript_31917/g.45949  ORF Transcript_31917/g.45949 Transcript_31917/m.45949 type:complete len:233 (-) Transcript_31917:37-735(-)
MIRGLAKYIHVLMMMMNNARKCLQLTSVVIKSRNFHPAYTLYKKVVELVPPLGESITEGSIAKWAKIVGEKIAVDDVVVIVETDKVTVDIKSTLSGVLTQQLATDTVIVGHPLYEIDTELDVNVPPVKTLASEPTSLPPSPSNESKSHSGHRKPSIHFMGKRSKVPHHEPTSSKLPQQIIPIPSVVKESPKKVIIGNGIDFRTLKDKGMHGRPKISILEAEAIESGGATLKL